MRIMGQLVSTLTLLLAFIPNSQSWNIFPGSSNQQTQTPSVNSGDSTAKTQTLKEASIDSFRNGIDGATSASATSAPFPHRIKQTAEEMPELFNFFTPPAIITGAFEKLPSLFKFIIFYKPPVGITTVYTLLNLLLSRNRKLVRSLFDLDEMTDMDGGETTPPMVRRKKQNGRNLDLDEADGKLKLGMGGVDSVRAELCLAALGDDDEIIDGSGGASLEGKHKSETDTNLTPPPPPPPPPILSRTTPMQTSDPRYNLLDPVVQSKYTGAVKDALRTNASPRTATEDFIENTLEPLSRLEDLFKAYKGFDSGFYSRFNSINNNKNQRSKIMNPPVGSAGHQIEDPYGDVDILWMSAKVAEVRTLDALLRVLRERLLTSAMRLSTKERYRAWRLQWYENGFARGFKRYYRGMVRGKTLENDRVRLQLTSAALKRELERLGQVQTLLLNRPAELSEVRLLVRTQALYDGTLKRGRLDVEGARMALHSEYSRNGKFDSRISNSASTSGSTSEENSVHKYTVEAHDWTVRSRALVNDLVSETLKAAFQPNDAVLNDRNTTVQQDLYTLSEWANYNKCDFEGWDSALTLVEYLSKARLMREQKFLPSATDLKVMLRRYDVYGVPSSIATIAFALVVHNVVRPHWADIVKSINLFIEAIRGVIEARFIAPAKEIILNLLNQRESLMDEYSLANEEKSLDIMLKDLGLGDGTPLKRPEAVAEASRIYEKELAQGAIKNIFRGDLVRLLLIQVQQLKTGSLQTMGSIDDLMESNTLNLQLLATVPAFLLVTFGTRIFFRALYSLRSRELIVGFGDAKAEMGNLLRKMERCLLLASHEEDIFVASETSSKKDLVDSGPRAPVTLQPNELGEFILHMHSYLTILDYCSPPFPAKGCDTLHSSLQELLMQGQLSTKRQIALLQLIKAKHTELMKVN